MPGANRAVARTLYRELLRSCNRLERLMKSAPAAPLASAAVLKFVSWHATDLGRSLQPGEVLRRFL